MSLYNATGKRRWLRDARVAANYSASWIFAWNIPMDPDDPRCDFPAHRSTVGMSMIATGNSGMDVYMSLCWFDYYRLWLDTHYQLYRRIANVCAFDTKQTMDLNGYPHYGFIGLQEEATISAVCRGWSVGVWVPWITSNQLLPLTACQDCFGTMHLRKIEAMPLPQQEKMNKAFAPWNARKRR